MVTNRCTDYGINNWLCVNEKTGRNVSYILDKMNKMYYTSQRTSAYITNTDKKYVYICSELYTNYSVCIWVYPQMDGQYVYKDNIEVYIGTVYILSKHGQGGVM